MALQGLPQPDEHREARHRAIRRSRVVSEPPKGWDPDEHLSASRGHGFAAGYAAGFADAQKRTRN